MSQFWQGVTAGALPPSVSTSFATSPDNGTAVPVANVLTFHGVGGTFSASGSTVTFTVSSSEEAYTNVNTTPYVVLPSDQYLSVDTSGSAITIELPNTTTAYRTFVIKDRTGQAGAGHAITVTTVGGAVLIDGQPSFVLDDSFDSINLIWNNTSYEIY